MALPLFPKSQCLSVTSHHCKLTDCICSLLSNTSKLCPSSKKVQQYESLDIFQTTLSLRDCCEHFFPFSRDSTNICQHNVPHLFNTKLYAVYFSDALLYVMRHFSPSGSFSSYSSLHPVSDECSGSLVNLCPFAHITLVSRAHRNISLVWDIFIYLSICCSAWLSVSSAASMSSCLTSPVLPFCLFFFSETIHLLLFLWLASLLEIPSTSSHVGSFICLCGSSGIYL